MKEGMIQTSLGRLASLEWAGEKGPLILLHGTAGNALAWTDLPLYLPGWKIISVELPGHGHSESISDLRFDSWVEALSPVLRSEYGESWILGGHSWGAKLAALMAGAFPDQVRGLVLVDPSPSHQLRVSLDGMIDRMFAAELGPWPDIQSADASARTLPQYRHWDPRMKSVFHRGLVQGADGSWRARVSRATLETMIQSALLEDRVPDLQRYQGPTLLLVASESRHWQSTTNLKVFTSADQRVIHGNHWIHLDNPKETYEAMASWVF